MPDDTNLLLQSILNEQRETRSELMDMNKSMVKKDEFVSYREEMKDRFDAMLKRQDASEKGVADLKTEVVVNTNFRKGLINGIKYISGAIFVAILGVLGAIIPNLIMNRPNSAVQQVQQNQAPAYVAPAPTNTPDNIKALHLKIPKI